MQKNYDAIIIGSGQAGNPLAKDLAQRGLKVALVEQEFIGGCCINRGCTPTKTLVASAREIYLAKRGKIYGIDINKINIDFSSVIDRKNQIVESFRESGKQSLKNAQVDLYFGKACFYENKTIQVTKQDEESIFLTAHQHIFINAGARPALPKIEGLLQIPYLTSTSIMELNEIPEHLLVLGGGYIGLEFAQMFRRFGSKVTLIHRGPQVLSREDSAISEEIKKLLSEEGVRFYLNSKTLRVLQKDHVISLEMENEQGIEHIQGSHLLVAVGRIPNSDTLQLDRSGIKCDEKGYILVNGRLETNIPGIYALGDIKGGPAFTHISYDDYRIVRDNLLFNKNRTTEGRFVPYTVFTDPPLGRIGMTETEARKNNKTIQIAHLPFKFIARAIEMDETKGFIKVVVDQETGQILGASILGIEGGEIASMLQLAMMGKLHYQQLKDGIFSHPTLSESLNNLFSHLSP